MQDHWQVPTRSESKGQSYFVWKVALKSGLIRQVTGVLSGCVKPHGTVPMQIARLQLLDCGYYLELNKVP